MAREQEDFIEQEKHDKSFFNTTIYPIDVIYIKNMVMPMNCYECRFFKQIDTENCTISNNN